jgi:hypothetical protein
MTWTIAPVARQDKLANMLALCAMMRQNLDNGRHAIAWHREVIDWREAPPFRRWSVNPVGRAESAHTWGSTYDKAIIIIIGIIGIIIIGIAVIRGHLC